MYTTMLMSIMMLATLGVERTSAPTMRRSSWIAEMRRSTRNSRPSRATIANEPVAGTSAKTMIAKSKTFQPSLK